MCNNFPFCHKFLVFASKLCVLRRLLPLSPLWMRKIKHGKPKSSLKRYNLDLGPLMVLPKLLCNHTSLPNLLIPPWNIWFAHFILHLYQAFLQLPASTRFPPPTWNALVSKSPSGKHLLIVQPSLIITSSVKPFSIVLCKFMDTASVSKKHHMQPLF